MILQVENLTKRFGEIVAVDGLSFEVDQGEIFGLLGPNGAGKTTTIRMIAGLIKPTAGAARVAGYDVQTHPLEARRRMAYVPDFPFLYEKLTPWEFFRFTGQLFRMEDALLEDRGRALIERFGLEPYVHKPIEGLSHGTRQRTAIRQAIADREYERRLPAILEARRRVLYDYNLFAVVAREIAKRHTPSSAETPPRVLYSRHALRQRGAGLLVRDLYDKARARLIHGWGMRG